MKKQFLLTLLFIPFFLTVAQETKSFDEDMNHAYTNAKKGIYFALSNIPETRKSYKQDLIEGDKLLASINLSKETNGVKVVSLGYFKTYTVEIVIYRSFDSLKKDGFR